MLTLTQTTFATVTRDENGYLEVSGTADQIRGWARNPYTSWPCSTLAASMADDDTFVARFDGNGDLIDIRGNDCDVPSDELNAWTSDALIRAGYPNHPAIR